MQEIENMKDSQQKHDNYTKHDVKEHVRDGAKWIVIEGNVYDISTFTAKHPGGENIIGSYLGQDATDAWDAFHKDRETAFNILKSLYIGNIKEDTEVASTEKNMELEADFRTLRQSVEKAGLMTPKPLFFCRKIAFMLGLEILGYLVLDKYGYTWAPYFVAAICFVMSQMEAGSLKHDFGHMSVFKWSKLNRLIGQVISGHCKGLGIGWWNLNHNEHHSRPNGPKEHIESEANSPLLNCMFGPKGLKLTKKEESSLGRRIYYSLILVLMSAARAIEANFQYMLKKQDFVELGLAMTFYIKAFYFLNPVLGGPAGAFGMLFLVLNTEIQLTFFVLYKGHALDVGQVTDVNCSDCWVTRQVGSSNNMKQTLLSDWLFGTRSYEIEHHLFPMIPDHNIHLVAPMVRDLCRKHNIEYKETTACSQIWRCIRQGKKTFNVWVDFMTKGYGW